MPVGGALHRASMRSVVRLTRGLALSDFEINLDSDAGHIRVTGGREADTSLVIAIASEGAPPDTQRVAMRGPVFPPTLLPLAVMLADEPEVGDRRTLTVFDPTAMAPREVTILIAAESLFTSIDSARMDRATQRWVPALRDTVRAWRLEADGEGPARLAGWVDAQGRIVRVTQPGDLTMQRMAYEIAYENWRLDRRARQARATTADSDILESTAIAANQPLAKSRRERLSVRLTKVSLDGFDLDGGRQRLTGDTLHIAVEPATALAASYELPASPALRSRFPRELAAEPLLQVADPRIRGLARRLRAGERDPRIVAERIHRWVHDSLAKNITFGLPNATQVLATRSGDCNEHTQLFIALARSAGVPARGAAGLGWVRGKFYYHAWPEVFLGDWVAVDPTFGEFPADAAHLRFVTGGLDRQAELLRLIGNLEVDVVP
jgi:transglutaminase-like putative cysteine protease